MNLNLLSHCHGASLLLAFTICTLLGCTSRAGVRTSFQKNQIAVFEAELLELQSLHEAPGLSYVIVDDGEVIASTTFGTVGSDSDDPYTAETLQDIASIAKVFVGTIIMQLVEDGRLKLSDSVVNYLPDAQLPANVTIEHILTHTSEGIVGQEYVYGSSRFGMLPRVIEAVTGLPFEETLNNSILKPAGMRLYPSPGGTSSMWMFSTLTEMTKFMQAMDSGVLLSEPSLTRIAIPSKNNDGNDLPNSLGWFAQDVQGVRVLWSYGHDNETGALLMRIPERNLSFYMHANSVTMSDSDRLLMGDLHRSILANSFLRLFVFSVDGEPIPHPDFRSATLSSELDMMEEEYGYSYYDELLAHAQAEASIHEMERAESIYRLVRARYGFDMEGDVVTHHYLGRLDSRELADDTIEMGENLLEKHPDNRWILTTQASMFARAGEDAGAIELYERVLTIPNQQDDWLHNLFDCWTWGPLATLLLDRDPTRARHYLNSLLESEYGCSGRQNAEDMLARLK